MAALWLAPDRRSAALTGGVALGLVAVLALVGLGGRARPRPLIRRRGRHPRRGGGDLERLHRRPARRRSSCCAGCGAVVAAAASSLLRPVDAAAPLRRAWEIATTVPERPGLRAARAAGAARARDPDRRPPRVVPRARRDPRRPLRRLRRRRRADAADDVDRRGCGRRGPPRPRRARGVGRRRASRCSAPGRCSSASAGRPRSRWRSRPRAATARSTSATGPTTRSPCRRRTTRCRRRPTRGGCSRSRRRGSATSSATASAGSLIDAHPGARTTSGGRSRPTSPASTAPDASATSSRVGEQAFDAALRIRDRITGTGTGELGTYLCHGFCELGAIAIDKGFGEIRDFVAANPNEVVTVVIEDYVAARRDRRRGRSARA